MSQQVLLFHVGEEDYALSLDSVESIFPLPKTSVIPKQPHFFEGFFEHEGECIPLLNLHRLVGAAENQKDANSRALVLVYGGVRLAVRVDGISGSREVDDFGETHSTEGAKLISVAGKNYILLNLSHLLEGNLTPTH